MKKPKLIIKSLLISLIALTLCIGTHPAQAAEHNLGRDRICTEHLLAEPLCPSYNWFQFFIWNIDSCDTGYDNNYISIDEEANPIPKTAGNEDPDSIFRDENHVDEVIRLINAERAQAGLKPLIKDDTLSRAADTRCGEIITVFSHTRPDGSSCFTALQQSGSSYTRAGENIAIGQSGPAQVVAAWMDSPGHRANIMDPRFSRIGVAVRAAGGNYGGYAWAQFFAD